MFSSFFLGNLCADFDKFPKSRICLLYLCIGAKFYRDILKMFKKLLIFSAVMMTMGLGVELGAPTLAQNPPSQSQQEELAKAEKLTQQALLLYQQGKYS